MKKINKWYYSLNKINRQLITIISWIFLISLGYLNEKLQIESQILMTIISIILIETIYFTVLYFKSSKSKSTVNNKQTDNQTFIETRNLKKEEYNQLILNDYSFRINLTNFESNLIIASLRQMKDNPYYNKDALNFDIDLRIGEFSKLADEQMKKSNRGSFVSVDIETTGLSTKTDRIVQISAVKVIDFIIIDSYTSYINPKKVIPSVASEIHGIYSDDIKDAPTFKEAFPFFEQFIENFTLVMHNSSFDYSIIKNECLRTFKTEFKHNVICTMKLWRKKYFEIQNEQATSAKLRDIVSVLLSSEQANDFSKNEHDALADAIATARIYLKML